MPAFHLLRRAVATAWQTISAINLNHVIARSLLSIVEGQAIWLTSSPYVRAQREKLCRSYLAGSPICLYKARVIVVSNSLQENYVFNYLTSKLLQFIDGASRPPTVKLLRLFVQDLSWSWGKSCTTRPLSCRLHSSLQHINTSAEAKVNFKRRIPQV